MFIPGTICLYIYRGWVKLDGLSEPLKNIKTFIILIFKKEFIILRGVFI